MTKDRAVEILTGLKRHLILDRPEEREVDEALILVLTLAEATQSCR